MRPGYPHLRRGPVSTIGYQATSHNSLHSTINYRSSLTRATHTLHRNKQIRQGSHVVVQSSKDNCNGNKRCEASGTSGKGEYKEYLAHVWWIDHLAANKHRKVGWLEFNPPSKYCCSHGFIPVQYVTNELQEQQPHNGSSSTTSSLTSASRKRITQDILKRGKQGVHYAIGWEGLYDLIRSYGQFRPDNHQVRPGVANHEIIVDYKGPPLPSEKENSGPPRQILTTSPAKPATHRLTSSTNDDATANATLQSLPRSPKRPAQDGNTRSDAAMMGPIPKRPRIESELERIERLKREDEAFCRAQEARGNRMVMIGFWESRRISFPSLYHEKFPNGIENAKL